MNFQPIAIKLIPLNNFRLFKETRLQKVYFFKIQYVFTAKSALN
jgi:hypothetical protein